MTDPSFLLRSAAARSVPLVSLLALLLVAALLANACADGGEDVSTSTLALEATDACVDECLQDSDNEERCTLACLEREDGSWCSPDADLRTLIQDLGAACAEDEVACGELRQVLARLDAACGTGAGGDTSDRVPECEDGDTAEREGMTFTCVDGAWVADAL